MDVEAKAREIADAAKQTRNRPSRQLWLAALIVSSLCLVALLVGYLTREPAEARSPKPAAPSGSGFGTGLLVGLAAGVAIGSALALRKRARD